MIPSARSITEEKASNLLGSDLARFFTQMPHCTKQDDTVLRRGTLTHTRWGESCIAPKQLLSCEHLFGLQALVCSPTGSDELLTKEVPLSSELWLCWQPTFDRQYQSILEPCSPTHAGLSRSYLLCRSLSIVDILSHQPFNSGRSRRLLAPCG